MKKLFSKIARGTADLAGNPLTFVGALVGVMIWAALGPMTGYSTTWQLWINTTTTILTFLMVFLLQHTQNHDTRALQIKLDELLRAMDGARNEFIDLENLSEEELTRYCTEFRELHLKYVSELEQRRKEGSRPPQGVGANVALAPAAKPRSDDKTT